MGSFLVKKIQLTQNNREQNDKKKSVKTLGLRGDVPQLHIRCFQHQEEVKKKRTNIDQQAKFCYTSQLKYVSDWRRTCHVPWVKIH